MKKQIWIYAILVLFLVVVFNVQAQNTTSSNYNLVWEDNFEINMLDASKWTVIENGEGGGNNELQYYRRQNISIGRAPVSRESCLIITARKQRFKGKTCTSGRIVTKGKMAVKYGKIEARISLPKTNNGLWPAFWMLGNDHPQIKWPACGEIDILEMGSHVGIKNYTQEMYFSGACHWGENFESGKYSNLTKSSTSTYSLQNGFHLYTLIWDNKTLKMYLDQDKFPDVMPYYEMPVDTGNPKIYFHKPFYILLNLAIGGDFTHIFDINKITALKYKSAKMYVDYVKVYQKGDENEALVTSDL